MKTRIAVLDLGTNTFHLLIAEGGMPDFTEIVHITEAVKLGEGGINEGIIRPEAYQRGIAALNKFKEYLDKHQPARVKALGTSALRSTANGPQFVAEVHERTGIQIETINGDAEAGHIFKAIQAAGCLTPGNNLIVDIGGGSVELIWCNQYELFWKHSFEIGAARLMAQFHQQDPIPANNIISLYSYLDEQLADLFKTLGDEHINTLIGSSGAFETFAELLQESNNHQFNWKDSINYTFDTDSLTTMFQQLASSSHQERAANPNILPVRVDMIVVASLLTQFLIDRLYPDQVKVSAFSLKEGVLAQLFEEDLA